MGCPGHVPTCPFGPKTHTWFPSPTPRVLSAATGLLQASSWPHRAGPAALECCAGQCPEGCVCPLSWIKPGAQQGGRGEGSRWGSGRRSLADPAKARLGHISCEVLPHLCLGPGSHMGAALLLLLFCPSVSENPASCGMKDLEPGCLQSMTLLGQLSLGMGVGFQFPRAVKG